ncbi:tetrathionate reductase family octaheme c-type cytochrome [Flammeovirga yaeyamensis]|uniref:Tetrathionate reductase family octaheme c-type cytochrome n=1 Tax=Flammeovirga yaeyamensis TaxID=367791 RepID=A0AAX1NDT6_9BACT|nr:tetrathionate reductase family octaheme c-type cytochrome [Flammeovirga yaeyamensis]MBB3700088.1 octaheme c-type cytochrome (tetrathionate reductase family) [Flammeovirga yaeyamensis]NMF37477.1 tetrathionate reductase family octaheme c-type cytochrome [Flammeovirga yaeyamensis]QWG04535.1 tetrathionate reductase family octaheme c-type cytochrome [Flammeovirga yaeyamensis]
MKKNILIIVFFNFLAIVLFNVFWSDVESSKANTNLVELKQKFSKKKKKIVDHSKFEILQQDFINPTDVTTACISCHQERHHEVMESNHWNWEREEYIEGRGVTYLGKKNIINNFCIGATGNEQACAKCHIGYGYEKNEVFFATEKNVDCLACHNGVDDYIKNGGWGKPNDKVDLKLVAQSVGHTSKANCGTCHFFSGGGNNVKHGDLEVAQLDCSREVDVHMASDGIDLSCTDCHVAENHNIKGKLYSLSSENKNRATCEDCHTSIAHQNDILNSHTKKIACQTCHIPTYAKENATKMTWDWSTAGKLKDGKPYHTEDEMGNHDYLSIKGSFTWEKNVKPEYIFFNGTADHYVFGDKADTLSPIQINTLHGSYADGKIIPVKVHRAVQPYDPENKILIQPYTFNPEKGSGAYWTDFDWVEASRIGQKKLGLPFSGKVDFAKTEMYWPINHMVSPKENSMSCVECHTRASEGRLFQLAGFYMPGRDTTDWLDQAGKWLILLSILGVVTHAIIRVYFKIIN